MIWKLFNNLYGQPNFMLVIFFLPFLGLCSSFFNSKKEKKHKIYYSTAPFTESYDHTTTDIFRTDSDEIYDVYYQSMKQDNHVDRKRLKCRHANTIYNELDEICECFPGFPHGDPDVKPGCWRCDQVCHPNAECRYPGRCWCPRGFHGDGIFKCDEIIMRLLSISPTAGVASGGDIITAKYEYKNGRKTTAMFCRFGSTYVQAENFTDDTIYCKTPQLRPGTYRVAVSYNADMWSKNNITFIAKDDSGKYDLVFPIAVISAIIFFVIMILMFGLGTGMIKPTKEETEPFIKKTHKGKTYHNGVRRRLP
ncbi:hypothetical protein TRFO_12657 [Tritrichomonas foetus]|uniref:EGF-like domain-containing protein n=1 Tax=Tritrichomonas foetus TaxID=1144522 RepID=A0A1J4L140_9EUKA|nr:hypothetical protein TRFO_12657 [Tritrichomonas foetus]|eukprot:OHT17130.1 hypothetical protein TRFO_12657 [Tritrichomonas foetus]